MNVRRKSKLQKMKSWSFQKPSQNINNLKKTALITGITGQDGAYLAEFLLAKSSVPVGNGANKGRKALRRYIGGVKHGRLTSGIDDELYGQAVR